MITDEKKPSVYGTMLKILNYLNSPQEQKNLAANLAEIRNSTGRYEDAVGVWPILFPLIPEEYLGNGSLSYEEKALFVALQLYAIGQQGSNKMVNDESEKRRSFGCSLRQIRNERSTSLDRRFNVMLTATTFDEFTYHLRQIFKLGKSDNTFSVNFSKLAEDLFWYQNGKNKQISLNWAKDYYRYDNKKDNDQSQTTENDDQTNENKEAK